MLQVVRWRYFRLQIGNPDYRLLAGTLKIFSLQILLDRGEQLYRFGSTEILVEALTNAAVFHTFTAGAPFVRPSRFRDRNISAGMLFVFVFSATFTRCRRRCRRCIWKF
jgi:hypothetical protein